MTVRGDVLLLGASGFFGPHLTQALGARLAARTYATHPVDGALRFDARSDSVRALLDALPARPAAAVLALGMTSIDACAGDPQGSAALNVEAVLRVARELHGLGVTPVFLSSDAVFDGSRADSNEDDPAVPILTYGRQKRAVERAIAELPPPWLVVRLPKLLSPQPDPRCMLWQWIDALGRPQRILCATDQYFTPAAADEAAGAIATLIGRAAQGLYHIAGPERLSRRALLQAVIDAYRAHAAPRAEVVECRLREVPVFEPRPLDASMSVARLAADFGLRLRPASTVARAAVERHFASARSA